MRSFLIAVGLAMGISAGAQADIIIGFGTGISGQLAPVGEQARRGAEAAIADINAKGGIKGEKLVLQLGDDGCDPKQAVTIANQFATAGIKFVLGHLCSGATLAAEDVYAEEGILMITGSATSPEVTERGHPLVFRACGRDDQQTAVAAAYVAKEHPGKKVAVVDDKQAYGKGLADAAKAALEAQGIKPSFTGSINAGDKDYTALIHRLKDEKIDILYYGGYHPELGLIARQAKQAGFSPLIITGEGMNTPEYWAIAGDAAEGTLFTNTPDILRNPDVAPLVETLRKTGPEPDNFTFYYYSAMQILAEALAKAPALEPAAVGEYIHSSSFKTIVGELSFDSKGDLANPAYVIYRWSNGKFDYAQ